MQRIKLVLVEPDKYHVHFDGAAIGTLVKRAQINTGLQCAPRWCAFGSFKPTDFASKVAAIRHVVMNPARPA